MKLLLDENLSRRLVPFLQSEYPGSTQVALVGLQQADDQAVVQRGFTLVELAIVMFIVALLLGGMLMPLSAQMDIRARGETEKTLNDVRDALIGFALTNGRLPRPAVSAINGAEAGTCADDTACNGFIPWAALGSVKLDGWGHLIRYSVTPAFANANISLSTVANRTVWTRDTAGTAVYLAGSATCSTPNQCAPVVVFSQGKSHWGTTETGSALADSSGTNIDEDVNNGLTTINFFSRGLNENTTMTGGEFDDILIWISGNTLFNRMVAAGRLP